MTNAIMNRSERDDLICYIWDAYKDVNGFRPRWMNFEGMSVQDLRDEADYLSNEISNSIKRENARMEHLSNMLNCNRDDLERWLDYDNIYQEMYAQEMYEYHIDSELFDKWDDQYEHII